jgi:hypothetical protein
VCFATQADMLRAYVGALGRNKRPLHLTMEAGPLTRWACGIVRPLVQRLIICEPRHNRLINSNPQKSDEADVEGMCLLLRLSKLKEVWMGTDRTREIYRALVYELLNWRDAQRELKALIKARYRQWGVLRRLPSPTAGRGRTADDAPVVPPIGSRACAVEGNF